MGVNLRDILFWKTISMQELAGKTLAVDALNVIYQFLSSIRQPDGTPLLDSEGRITSHLSGLFYRCAGLIENNVKLIFVFDGEAPEFKAETAEDRRKIREEAREAWDQAKKRGDVEEASKWAQRSTKVDAEIIEESKKILTLMGIPWIQACGEGEAQAAFLVQKGEAWAIVTQDYDALLFGAPRVIRNLAAGKDREIEFIDLNENLEKLGISRENLVELAIMVGTDFNKGVRGIGPKTGLKIVKNHEFEEIVQKNDLKTATQIKELFLNPHIHKEYQIEFKKYNEEELKKFLLSRAFSENRILNTLKKLNPPQKSLNKWFG